MTADDALRVWGRAQSRNPSAGETRLADIAEVRLNT
jgi:hypothetical protein